jgi:hypothetical protein
MFSIKNWIYLGLILSPLVVFIPRSAAQTISCSSEDGKRHYCSANGPGRARLVISVANPPAPKATVGARMTGASGSITAAGLISPSKNAMVGTEIMTVMATMTAIATTMGIATTTTDPARDKSSRAHRMTCTGTIAQLTRAAACN